jgi:hypothetical protein
MGEGNESLVYPWDFKRSLTYRKILRHGTSGFTSHLKEGVLLILSPLKSIALAEFEPATLGPVGSTLTTTPPSRLRRFVAALLAVTDTSAREPQHNEKCGCRAANHLHRLKHRVHSQKTPPVCAGHQTLPRDSHVGNILTMKIILSIPVNERN